MTLQEAIQRKNCIDILFYDAYVPHFLLGFDFYLTIKERLLNLRGSMIG